MYLLYAFLLQIFSVLVNAGDEREKGIVLTVCDVDPKKAKDILQNDYRHWYFKVLECSYEDTIQANHDETTKPNDRHRDVFFVWCDEVSNTAVYPSLILFLNEVAIDFLRVSSCDRSGVQKSIFPQIINNGVRTKDQDGEDILSLRMAYKTVDGSCYERSYEVKLDKTEHRYKFIKAGSPVKTRDSECETVKLSNCRPAPKDFKGSVIEATDQNLDYPPNLALIGQPGTTKQLECKVQLPGPEYSDFYYELICIKVLKIPEGKDDDKSSGDTFFAFVNYGSSDVRPIERFAVVSCKEDDIVNAIFPGRVHSPESTFPRLKFKQDDKCFTREYDVNDNKVLKQTKFSCPRCRHLTSFYTLMVTSLLVATICYCNYLDYHKIWRVFDWVNPQYSGSMVWRDCKGLQSNSESGSTSAPQSVSAAETGLRSSAMTSNFKP